MNSSNYTIKVGYGKYNHLDKAYVNLIRNQINDNKLWIDRWEIYDEIIQQIIQLDNVGIFESIKYRVTGGEDINQVLLDIMQNELEPNLWLRNLMVKVQEYYDIDWLKDFYE